MNIPTIFKEFEVCQDFVVSHGFAHALEQGWGEVADDYLFQAERIIADNLQNGTANRAASVEMRMRLIGSTSISFRLSMMSCAGIRHLL
ncbi:MAG: hypothetical protein FJZ94_04005 [Chloroflexi bacterium]|nr:hypothetical protein [Chloroflexota bacterium]